MANLLFTPTVLPRRAIFSNRYSRVLYLDINTDYMYNGKQIQLENIDAISNEIGNLIATTPGEDAFEPTYGSGIMGLLFSPTATNIAQRTLNLAYQAFDKWIPAVTLNKKASSVTAYPLQATYYLIFVYSIKGLTSSAQTNLRITK